MLRNYTNINERIYEIHDVVLLYDPYTRNQVSAFGEPGK